MVAAVLLPHRQPRQPKETGLDKLARVLDVAHKGLGIISDVQKMQYMSMLKDAQSNKTQTEVLTTPRDSYLSAKEQATLQSKGAIISDTPQPGYTEYKTLVGRKFVDAPGVPEKKQKSFLGQLLMNDKELAAERSGVSTPLKTLQEEFKSIYVKSPTPKAEKPPKDIAKEKLLSRFGTLTADMQTIYDNLASTLPVLDDPKISDKQKITFAEGVLENVANSVKVLKISESQHKRIGRNLTFDLIGYLKGEKETIKPNIPAFKQQVELKLREMGEGIQRAQYQMGLLNQGATPEQAFKAASERFGAKDTVFENAALQLDNKLNAEKEEAGNIFYKTGKSFNGIPLRKTRK